MSAPSAVSRPEMVRGLQERTARALPAEHVEHAGGWWLRHAPSCSWWVGTVLPHGDAAPGELAGRVAGAEAFYAGHGAAARFQISPGACPEGLDTVLAERGYRREGSISLRVASAAQVLTRAAAAKVPGQASEAPGPTSATAGAARVRLDDRPTPAWFEVWHAVHGEGGDPRPEWDMLGRVERPAAYAAVLIGDEVVAVGRAVADTGWTGVFGMATLPEARGRGAARDVLAALARWARARDAGRMYLQVEPGNIPALRVYERMGFREICGYHYRTAP